MDFETEELNIPEWHINLVRIRREDYKNNPDDVIDFNIAIDDIERELSL